MLLSMTGYGKSKVILGSKVYTIEIKCLNSKQLDLNFKMLSEWREKELDIRKMIADKLVRGKVDVYFQEDKSNGNIANLNFEVIEHYFRQLQAFSSDKNIPLGDILPAILRFQEVSKTEIMEWSDDDTISLQNALMEALDNAISFRKDEGMALEKDLVQRITAIQFYRKELEPFERNRLEKLTAKLKQDLANYIQEESIDKNRFEEELLYYIEKIDINEEKVRLDTHSKYFLQVLDEHGMEKGKKLGFIAQEIGREINTIGSKANDADIQRCVILMKEELEKIKEQALNIL